MVQWARHAINSPTLNKGTTSVPPDHSVCDIKAFKKMMERPEERVMPKQAFDNLRNVELSTDLYPSAIESRYYVKTG